MLFLVERVVTTKDINAAIHRQLQKSRVVKIGDSEKGGLSGQDSIAVGLSRDVEIIVTGDAGDFFGAFNQGAVLTLNGTAGRFLGDSMSGGGIIVKGRVRHGVGVYQKGGIIVIKGGVEGDAGNFNNGGTIIVNGKAGDGVGSYMMSGTIIITGTAGKNLGNWMVGGEIYIAEEPESLGRNAEKTNPTQGDMDKLRKYFEHYGIIYDDLDGYIKIVAGKADPYEPNNYTLEVRSID